MAGAFQTSGFAFQGAGQFAFQTIASGAVVAPSVGGGGKPKRKRPEYVVWDEPEKAPDLSSFEHVAPPVVSKAIEKILARDLPDDTKAIHALKSELGRLKVPFRPEYAQAVRQAFKPVDYELERRLLAEEAEDLEVILMLLH